MRRTILIQGNLMRDLPKPIDEAINTVIAKNPEFELIQTVVLHSSNSSCTLLCVFEKKDTVFTKEDK